MIVALGPIYSDFWRILKIVVLRVITQQHWNGPIKNYT